MLASSEKALVFQNNLYQAGKATIVLMSWADMFGNLLLQALALAPR